MWGGVVWVGVLHRVVWVGWSGMGYTEVWDGVIWVGVWGWLV